MSIIKWNKRLTYSNILLAIQRTDVYQEVLALRKFSTIWRDTHGIFNQFIFIIKVLICVLPILYILLFHLIKSIQSMYQQIKGVIEGDIQYADFPFNLNDAENRRAFLLSNPKLMENTNLENGRIKRNLVHQAQEAVEEQAELDTFKLNRKKIVSSTKLIRKTLIRNDFVLDGKILQTKFPKIKIERLLEMVRLKDFNETYLLQKVDFGAELNKALFSMFSGIVLKKKRGILGTYLLLKDNDVNKLEDSLRRVFMNNKIKIKLRNIEVKGEK